MTNLRVIFIIVGLLMTILIALTNMRLDIIENYTNILEKSVYILQKK